MPKELEKKPAPKAQPKTPSQKVIDKACKLAVEEERSKFGISEFTCYLCGKPHNKINFYKNTDTLCISGVTPICKDCCDKIVYQIGADGVKLPPTKESVAACLYYLNKPFLSKLWDSSLLEAANTMSGKPKNDVWTSYIKNVQMTNYRGLQWKDSDMFNNISSIDDRESIENDKEILEMYEINKRNVVSALGYDPFESAPDADKPLMYGKLSGMLDESTSEDEVKLGACIEITHSFNQAERLNYVINSLQKTPESIIKNSATIKALEETKNKIFSSALSLAKENGITINSSNKNTKGSNTWTGKVKEMKEMKLRDAEVNAFDVGTAEGIRQVAEASASAIFKQLALDENDYTDMIKQQRELLDQLQSKLAAAEEESRIYKREIGDLKSFLRDKHLINEKDEVIYND